MSTSYTASLVAGIDPTDVMTTKVDKETVTKYNPDNGKPYKKERVHEHHFFGKHAIDELNGTALYEIEFELKGLTVFAVGYESSDVIVGVAVHDSGDINYNFGAQEISVKAIQATLAKAKKALLAAGISLDPRLFFITSAG